MSRVRRRVRNLDRDREHARLRENHYFVEGKTPGGKPIVFRERTTNLYLFGSLLALHSEGLVDQEAIDRARDWMLEGTLDSSFADCTIVEWADALRQLGLLAFQSSDIHWEHDYDFRVKLASNTIIGVETVLDFLDAEIEAKFCGRNYIGPTARDPNDHWPFLRHKIMKQRKDLFPLPGDQRAVLFQLRDHAVLECVEAALHGRNVEWAYNADEEISSGVDTAMHLFETTVSKLLKGCSDAIADDLRQEYEYLQSNEYLTDISEANEYTFTESGVRQ